MHLQFFESIKILDGKIINLHLHIARMNRALQTYYPQQQIFTELPITIPQEFLIGLVKCKVIYAPEIVDIQFSYYLRQIPNHYVLAFDDNMNYNHKYLDRTELDEHRHKSQFADEVIIVKHNMITDATYSNVCFWNGHQWHTPKYPLLKGIKRQQLLAEKKIIEKVILIEDLHDYKTISFINALNDLEERTVVCLPY
jgi:4-amino-4-deoxychorismate lyase